jgi:hypothetical protein
MERLEVLLGMISKMVVMVRVGCGRR